MKEIIYSMIISATPIFELRGAIPYALTHGLSWQQAIIFSVIGNMIPVFFILWWLEPVSNWLRKRFAIFEKFFTWLFEYTRKKHAKNIQTYKELGLVILVAIPLPMTGAWSGSLVAFLFGIPYKKAVPLIFAGVFIAAVLVTLASTGVIHIFGIAK